VVGFNLELKKAPGRSIEDLQAEKGGRTALRMADERSKNAWNSGGGRSIQILIETDSGAS